MRYPSIARITSALNVSDDTARAIRRAMGDVSAPYYPPVVSSNIRFATESEIISGRVETPMERIDALLENFGVECLHDNEWCRYWHSTGMIYSNTGDMYTATVCYDTRSGLFSIRSVGDILESRAGAKRFGGEF